MAEIIKENEELSTPSTNEFSRAVIDSMNKQVKLVDSDNGLDLFCYIRCESVDSDILKKCRGVVFNGESLVMNGFPYTYEFTEDNNMFLENNLSPIFNKCSFYDSHEGSLIRMFHFGGKWYTSTNRKLDANKSKWSSKESFGVFFRQALESELEVNENLRNSLPDDISIDVLERFQSILDTDKQYMFLLLNNEQNRIVCAPSTRPTFFHVGTFINGELSMSEDINIRYPTKHSFSSINDVYNFVSSVDIYKTQGIIVFAPGNLQYKIFNKEYYDLYKVRGNEPSIKFRYLQVRMDKRYNNLLHYLYPNFSSIFEDYENIIYAIAKFIHNAYFERFIKNQYTSVPKEEYEVIRACHDWHLKDREKNKINLNKVIEILNTQSPTNINKMIRRYYLEQLNKEKAKNNTGDVPSDENFPDLEKSRPRTQRLKYKPLLKRNNSSAANLNEKTDVAVAV